MNKICQFELVQPFKNYDTRNNPRGYNGLELAPKEVKWQFQDKTYSIRNDAGIQAELLENDSRIVLIEGIYGDKKSNDAYLIDGLGQRLFEISQDFPENLFMWFYRENQEIHFVTYHIPSGLDEVLIFDQQFQFLAKRKWK